MAKCQFRRRWKNSSTCIHKMAWRGDLALNLTTKLCHLALPAPSLARPVRDVISRPRGVKRLPSSKNRLAPENSVFMSARARGARFARAVAQICRQCCIVHGGDDVISSSPAIWPISSRHYGMALCGAVRIHRISRRPGSCARYAAPGAMSSIACLP